MKILKLIFFLALTSFNSDTGPVLTIDKELHNYGIIEYGSNGVCQFTIRNTGSKILVISDIKTSCGCTIVNTKQRNIKPGDSTVLNVRYDTKRPGAINKKILIHSNDLESPQKEIFIKGYVETINYKKNILVGDSQTPFIDKWSHNATLLNKVGSESSLWKGGIGLNWLKLAITNYKQDTLIESVTFCIGTNGKFSSKDDIIGLVNITKERFPKAYLYVIQGSWGWGGNVNVTKPVVDSYYKRFSQLGVVVIEPPIGKCEPHNVNLPQYKEIANNLDSLISKQNK